MSDVGQLQFNEILSFYDDQYVHSGLVYVQNVDEDNPWELPQTLEATWTLLDESWFFGSFNSGRLIINRGVINGWADYEVLSVNPEMGTLHMALQDGQLFHPNEALQNLRDKLAEDTEVVSE